MPPRRHLPRRVPLQRDAVASSNTPGLPGVMLLYVVVLVVGAAIITKLFYLQVIRHEYYQQEAKAEQLKKYEIPAARGDIYASDGTGSIPLVLNERLFSVIADPLEVKNDDATAKALAGILKTDRTKLEDRFKKDNSRYELIGSKVSREVKDKIVGLALRGIYVRENSYRTYPQGTLAAQVLGFVNDEGQGQYGVEGFMDSTLRGKAGFLKAITDRNGVPLAANESNVISEPVNGKKIELTIDIIMQRIAEEKLKSGLDRAKSKSGNVIIIDPNTGAIKAMASYPSFDPAKFTTVENGEVFKNKIVTDQVEPGSIMKPLLVSAALDTKAIDSGFTYTDKGFIVVDGVRIKNSHDWGIPTEDLKGILQRSLNTGAVSILMAMGGGEINQAARERWYTYLTEHYLMGQETGVEQSGESPGSVVEPTGSSGLNVQYANMSFGQGIGVTLMQMAAASSAMINGGTYWQPHVVAKVGDTSIAPSARKNGALSASTSDTIRSLLNQIATTNYPNALRTGYTVGGKTGTAEFVGPDGKYYADRFNGTFMGFVGGDVPQYLMIVKVDDPRFGDAGSAGLAAAEPIFADIVQSIIDAGRVTPKR